MSALGVVAALALAGPAHADVGLRLEPEHTVLHRLETINMFVTVSNDSFRTIFLDPQRRPGNAYLDFDVRRTDDRMPRPIVLAPVPASGEILPGTSRQFLIDLSKVGNLRAIGGYNVQAVIVWNERHYETRIMHIDVVGGMPLKSVTRDSPLDPQARRTYGLSYLARAGREILFLSVDEVPSDLNYGVFALGGLVRVFDPAIEVDSSGRITVVHQSRPSEYVRSILQSTPGGVRLVDQSREELRGHVGAQGEWELESDKSDKDAKSNKSKKKPRPER